MKFGTKYDRILSKPEKNSGERITEIAGYIPAQTKIENMIYAGQRLVESRKAQYDFPDGKVDESYYNPTRSKNFDLADAFQYKEALSNKLNASQTSSQASNEALNNEIDEDIKKTQKAPDEPK